VKQKLPIGHGAAEIPLQYDPLLHRQLEGGIKEADPIAAGVLGAVHGQIGLLHQLLGAHLLPIEQGHANACRTPLNGIAEMIDVVQRRQDLVGNRLGARRSLFGAAIQAGQNDDELVTAEASDGVFLAYTMRKSSRDLLQENVAGIMPQGVVKRLEVIQIDEQQSAMAGIAQTSGKVLLQAIEQKCAIGQRRQLIKEGQFPYSFFCLPTLGYILSGRKRSHRGTCFVAQQGIVPGHDPLHAGAGENDVFVAFDQSRLAGHQAGEDPASCCLLAGRQEVVEPVHTDQCAFRFAEQLSPLPVDHQDAALLVEGHEHHPGDVKIPLRAVTFARQFGRPSRDPLLKMLILGIDGPTLLTLLQDHRQHECEIAEMVGVGREGRSVADRENQLAMFAGAAGQTEAQCGIPAVSRRLREKLHSHDPGNVRQPLRDEGQNRVIRQGSDDALHEQKLSEHSRIGQSGNRHRASPQLSSDVPESPRVGHRKGYARPRCGSPSADEL
jgi:hypothetical protein